MHSPRPRIRGRDPHRSSEGGGRRGGRGRHHRRRSPPAPPSPRYQRRPQRLTPPPPPPPPRRGDDPHPDVSASASAANQRRSILLEAGRLAAHYLVAQGVIPEHLLRAKEDPPAPRPAQHPPATRGRKLDDGGSGGGGDLRPRRNDGHCWARAWEDDDRPARKSTGWDRRTQSFDDRRKYHDAGHDVSADRGARRSRDYDEPWRPPMSRSYSHNDRRPSADGGRVDPRSRSRSRSRTRSYYVDSSSCSRDLLDHTKVPDSAGGGKDYRNVDEMPRQQRSVHVAIRVGETELEMNHSTRDISEGEDGEFQQGICISQDEDGEFAAARLNGEGGTVEMDVTHTQHQLCDSDTKVHPSESVEEPVHRGAQLSNAVEDREMVVMDACTREALVEDNDCSDASARDGMVAPHPQRQSQGEAGVGDFNRHKPELPSSCRIFDLNVVETPDACELTEVSGDPQADHHVSDSVADLVGQVHQQTKCHASEIQGQDDRAGRNHMLKNGHDLIRYDLNSAAVEDVHDIHLLDSGKLLLSHGIDATRTQWGNGCLLLNQNADELEHENNWMENHTVIGEQLLLSDIFCMDGHPVPNHQMASQPKRSPMGVYDLHSYNLKSEEMLINDGADKHDDNCHLKDGQMLFNQPANRQARIHNRANERTIPVINLEDDDYEEQSDIREFLKAKSYQYLGPAIL